MSSSLSQLACTTLEPRLHRGSPLRDREGQQLSVRCVRDCVCSRTSAASAASVERLARQPILSILAMWLMIESVDATRGGRMAIAYIIAKIAPALYNRLSWPSALSGTRAAWCRDMAPRKRQVWQTRRFNGAAQEECLIARKSRACSCSSSTQNEATSRQKEGSGRMKGQL